MRVLLTRPRADSLRIAERLTAQGMQPLIWPMMEIRPTVDHIDIPEGSDAIAFTSANAVRIFAELHTSRALPVVCVGARTARAAKDAGFTTVQSADGDVRDLGALIASSGWRRVFHPHGLHKAGNLAQAVGGTATTVQEAAIYESVPSPPPDPGVVLELVSKKIDIVTLWSPRSAQLFLTAYQDLDGIDLSGTIALAISSNAAKRLESGDFHRIEVAGHPSAEGMLAALDALRVALRQ